MHNHRLRAFAILVGMALVTAVAIGHAKPRSDDAHGYRTGTLVPSDANECAGVPNCLSATLPPTSVPAKGRAEMRFACPVTHPNLWGWDAAQHEHIFVQMVDVDQFTVTVEGVNSSDCAGRFRRVTGLLRPALRGQRHPEVTPARTDGAVVQAQAFAHFTRAFESTRRGGRQCLRRRSGLPAAAPAHVRDGRVGKHHQESNTTGKAGGLRW